MKTTSKQVLLISFASPSITYALEHKLGITLKFIRLNFFFIFPFSRSLTASGLE